MSIPTGFFRITWNLNSRGPSGTRAITFAAGYNKVLSTFVYQSPGWFIEATTYAVSVFDTTMSSVLDNDTSLESVAIATAGIGATTAVGSGHDGTRGAVLAPPQMANIVRWRTMTPGRKGRGRMFLPDAAEGDYDEAGILTPTSTTLFQTFGDDMLASFAYVPLGTSWRSDVTGAVLLHSDGSTPSPIEFSEPNPQPGWLRRRGR